MPRFNELKTLYETQGLEIVAANYAQNDTEIQDFITTYGATYGMARVADDSGYTVPSYSTVFAIDRQGRLLWSGSSSLVTNAMVEDWLSPPAGKDGGKKEEGCSTSPAPGGSAAAAVLAALAVLGLRSKRIKARRVGALRAGSTVVGKDSGTPGARTDSSQGRQE
ncbi:MAG: hypothetical protein IT464_07175 [Planctomycetes bacterium]|nr:hypothetical protein [Planctomycetota bacterium]